METFERKTTNWEGLWYSNDYHCFTSAAINLSKLKDFKGVVRLYVRKNKFFNNGKNGRPNYVFCIRDCDSGIFREVGVSDYSDCPYKEDDLYYDENGERLYTLEDVKQFWDIMVEECVYGSMGPYDFSIENWIG